MQTQASAHTSGVLSIAAHALSASPSSLSRAGLSTTFCSVAWTTIVGRREALGGLGRCSRSFAHQCSMFVREREWSPGPAVLRPWPGWAPRARITNDTCNQSINQSGVSFSVACRVAHTNQAHDPVVAHDNRTLACGSRIFFSAGLLSSVRQERKK